MREPGRQRIGGAPGMHRHSGSAEGQVGRYKQSGANGDGQRESPHMHARDQRGHKKGAKDSTDAPGEIEKRDGGGGVLGGQQRSAQVYGRVGEAVAKSIDADHKDGNDPGTQSEKGETNRKRDKSGGRHSGKTETREKDAGENNAEGAEKILGGEKYAGLSIGKGPGMGKVRQDRAQESGDDADEDETQVQDGPFTTRTGARKSDRGRGHRKRSVAQDE